MSDSECAINFVIKNEGGLAENKNDLGGITNFGISLRFLKNLPLDRLRHYGIFEEPNAETIRNLRLSQAKAIYKQEFWDNANFDKIVNQEYCNYIFDMAVNIGINPAIKCVQRACWAVQRDWHHLKDDGILAEQTLAAIKVCGFLIMPALRAERANHYRALVLQNPSQQEFLNAWFNRTYE